MIENLYAKYLLADRLNKLAGKAGVDVDFLELDNGGRYGYDVKLQVGAYDRREGESDNVAERGAIRLLDAMPELALERSSGLILLTGTAKTGLTYRFYTGSSPCEMVQVGTRIVPAQLATPERTEPIFEKRCIDDLRELVNA